MTRSLSFCAASVLLAGFAAAAPIDDAQRNVTAADKSLATVARELKSLGDDPVRRASELALIAKRIEQIAQSQRRSAPLIAQAIQLVDADLAAARRDLAAAQQRFRDAEAAETAAKAALVQRRAAVDRVAKAERDAFLASPDYAAADTRVKDAEAALAEVERDVAPAMAADPTVGPLLKETADAEAAVRAARNATPANDDALAEASGAWIDASNRFGKAKADFYANQPRHVEISQALRDARRAAQALVDTFDRSILVHPGVAVAQLELRDAVYAFDAAGQAVSAARVDVGRLGRFVANRREAAQVIGRLRVEADADLADAADDLQVTTAALRDWPRQVAEITKQVTAARNELNKADDAIDKAREDTAAKKK